MPQKIEQAIADGEGPNDFAKKTMGISQILRKVTAKAETNPRKERPRTKEKLLPQRKTTAGLGATKRSF